MGFLSGAYGKLMAGKLVRQIQYQLTGVQSQLRRVTKEVGNMEKMFSAQERNIKAQMQSQMNTSVFNYMGGIGFSGFDPSNPMGAVSGMTQEQFSKYSMYNQMVQQQYSMAQSAWQDMFEMQRESVLQPLKDLEDDLQTQKDNLESRLKLAEQDYDAKKKEEQAGAKSFTPEYTSQA